MQLHVRQLKSPYWKVLLLFKKHVGKTTYNFTWFRNLFNNTVRDEMIFMLLWRRSMKNLNSLKMLIDQKLPPNSNRVLLILPQKFETCNLANLISHCFDFILIFMFNELFNSGIYNKGRSTKYFEPTQRIFLAVKILLNSTSPPQPFSSQRTTQLCSRKYCDGLDIFSRFENRVSISGT